LTKVVIMLKNS